jgi:hypothetical protein
MYPARFVQYLNLPAIPDHIVNAISTRSADYVFAPGSYWTDQHNQQLNNWCQQHICADMYFAFQCFEQDVELHRDVDTQIKLNYIITTGGDQVVTEFYQDDATTCLDQVIIQPNRWHVFRANMLHRVCNIQPNQTRFAVTARAF